MIWSQHYFVFCGDCGEECLPSFQDEGCVESLCCSATVYWDEELTREADAEDVAEEIQERGE